MPRFVLSSSLLTNLNRGCCPDYEGKIFILFLLYQNLYMEKYVSWESILLVKPVKLYASQSRHGMIYLPSDNPVILLLAAREMRDASSCEISGLHFSKSTLYVLLEFNRSRF